tara:strand:+ start:960 stop:1127 length:168 start_codon:yes stop_codon:yes gene_type:complete
MRQMRGGRRMTEKYIYCPTCRSLTIHARCTGKRIGWLCEDCNPSLYRFEEEEGSE